jgi:TolA-binding protein
MKLADSGMDHAEALRLAAESRLAVLQRRFDQAGELLNSLIRLYPDYSGIPEVYLQQALLMKQRGEFRAGIASADSVIVLYPESQEAGGALIMKGEMLERLGREKEAIKVYEELIEKYPGYLGIQEIRSRIREMEK